MAIELLQALTAVHAEQRMPGKLWQLCRIGADISWHMLNVLTSTAGHTKKQQLC